MDKNEQRMVIAEACGYFRIPETPVDYMWRVGAMTTGKATWQRGSQILMEGWLPNYADDLNAMHEAEKVLTEDASNNYFAFTKYLLHLDQVVCKEHKAEVDDDGWSGYIAFATAAQRAEAFLRTIGKWTDTELSSRNPDSVSSPKSVSPMASGAGEGGKS